MATVKASKFVNEVIYRVDQNSLKKVRDTNKRLSKEMSKTDSISGRGVGGRGRDSPQRATKDMNAHMKARQGYLKQEERQQRNLQRFESRKKERTDIFLEDPRFNGITRARADAYRTQLLQEKSSARLSQRMRTILKQEKDRTKELRKQNVIQQRMSSSVLQMAGGFVSAFAVMEGLAMATRTGMQMEGVAKSFLVSSENAEVAKENMAFAREEAMRLGLPLIDASKGFSRMMAAAGDKMSLDDLKTTFIGISEAATALGLSQADVSGTILAIQQMMSKQIPMGI